MNKKKDGDYYNEEMTISPVVGEGGGAANFIAVKTDISEKLLLEKQLIQAEKLSTVGTFVSGVAHELNNPLTSILGYAQMLHGNASAPEEMREELRVIAEQSRRVVEIVRNLLKFSRRSQEGLRPISLNSVVQSVFELHGYRMKTDGVVAEQYLSKNIPPVNGNFTQLQQVFLNIVVNAHHEIVRAGGRGRIVARTSSNEGESIVVIENDGPRIPEPFMEKIFDPFFTTKESGEGTGLGLFVSYGIVKDHGGRIFCENMAEGGVRFTVALPIAHNLDILDSGDHDGIDDKKIHSLRALLVDDEEPIRKMASTAMAQKGILALSAASVAEAIALLEEHDFDAIVSDVKMPSTDGYALGAWINERRPEMMKRLIFATGAIDQRMKDYCAKYGCRILEKPFDGAALVRMVVEVVKGSE
ncbi:MAG: response regulator [Nitrospinae bacterium]|nr:response regulator [Nitrospinota bacterium]